MGKGDCSTSTMRGGGKAAKIMMRTLILMLVLATPMYAQSFGSGPPPTYEPTTTDTCQDLNAAGITPQSLMNSAGAAVVAGMGAVALLLTGAAKTEEAICNTEGPDLLNDALQELDDEISMAYQDWCNEIGGCD